MNTHRMVTFLKAAALAILAVPFSAKAYVNAVEVDEAHNLKSEFVIPYKAWAKNWQAGGIKALYVVLSGGYGGTWIAPCARLRDVVELQNRFNIDGDASFFCNMTSTFMAGALGLERMGKLLENEYDVYVFAGADFTKLPPEYQYKILEQVCTKGKGLVTIATVGARDFMIPKREIKPLPQSLYSALPSIEGKKAENETKTYKFGKGKAVWINYSAYSLTRAIDYSRERFHEYDYQLMQVGRAIQWAAGKESRVQLEATLKAKADGLPKPSFTLKAEETIQAKVKIEWRSIRDNSRISLPEKSVTISPLGTTVNADFAYTTDNELPPIPAGRYIVDITVSSQKGDEAYGAIDVNVVSKYSLEKVEFVQDWCEPEEGISASVKLAGDAIPDNAKLVWKLKDCWGRILATKEAAPEKENKWEFKTPKHSTIGMNVEAYLDVDGRTVSVAKGGYTVAKRQRGHFNFLQWDGEKGVLATFALQQLRDAGHRLCLVTNPNNEVKRRQELADEDVSCSTYSTRILNDLDANGTSTPACWNDDKNAQAFVDKTVNNQRFLRQQGVFCYSLGDEGVTSGFCKHPACFEKYKEYLKLVYGSIDALNKSWGENYKDFSEVALLDANDLNEAKALAAKKYSRWYDRQAFARWNLMQYSKRFVEAYKKLDPLAMTGFEGTGGFKDDIELISSINTFYSPYPSIGDDILRSVADRSLLRANWMGYSKTGSALSDAAWRMIMKEMDSCWYWMWTGAGDWIGYLTPTLDYYPAIKDLKNEMAQVRNGLGDLLINLPTRHSGIAILYNVPSALTSGIENGTSFAPVQNSHEGWVRFIYQHGYDYKYITTGKLLGGALRDGGFKMLLLPFHQAMSKEEVDEVKAFVENGGTVVADIRPAVMDGHCNILPKGALDDVFGISRNGLLSSVTANLANYNLTDAIVDPSVTATTAKCETFKFSKDGKDMELNVMFRNDYGKGHAILLNFQFPKALIKDGHIGALDDFTEKLFVETGVSTPAALRAANGDFLPFTETRI
ncbi:MAG: beta-galactosidase trimerization domain-containing protein, partial [Victivallales bacterium]|nr:beta-galactosidase trimerization domain-containing protein [Victivallales bacterium]